MSRRTELYRSCSLCPRDCRVDRLSGALGVCREGAQARVSVACLHRGEEPPLSLEHGSGTVFFSGCTLHCRTCQNYMISSGGLGAAVTTDELAAIFLALEERGAHNLNLVTGTHFTPDLLEALDLARGQGLTLPVVWNSSGYEAPSTLELLDRHVDIYLPDLKTLNEDTSFAFCGRRDYPAVVSDALLAMVRAKPLEYAGELMKQGVIVRHLVLPGRTADTRRCLEWFHERLAGRALLSLMFQYLPLERGWPGNGERVSRREYDEVMETLSELELEDGFVQSYEETDEWIPEFNRANPFPPGFAEPVWHADGGFVSDKK